MKKLALLLPMLLLTLCIEAQVISLVKHFQPDLPIPGGTEFKEHNGQLYFTTNNSLWKTNGSSSTTTLIQEFSPNSQVYSLTALGGKLYFFADDGVHGLELWSTDGTTTSLVKDIYNGAGSAISKDFIANEQIRVMGGNMYFVATDSLHGFELYKSDGTLTGTKMVIDLNPSPTGDGTVLTTSGYLHSQGIEVMNGKVYFSGYPTGNAPGVNSGVWSTDGSDTGTHLIKDFLGCGRFFAHNSIVYFNAYNATQGGVWSSDGTAIGTSVIVPDLGAIEYQPLGGDVYFTCQDSGISRIYKSNGLLTGTINLGNWRGEWIYSGVREGHHLRSGCLTALNNKIYYIHDKSLWSTDGTVAGTSVAFQNPGWVAGPLHLTISSGKLYFKSVDTMRSDFWESDGTSAGTHRIHKADANVAFSNMTYSQAIPAYSRCGSRKDMYAFNGEVYFYNLYDTTLTTSGIITSQLYKYGPAPNSVSGFPQTSKINIYPNPSNNTINIAFEKPEFTYLTLTDQLGKTVHAMSLQQGDKSVSLQLGHLPSGLYYVRCFGSRSSSVHSVHIVH